MTQIPCVRPTILRFLSVGILILGLSAPFPANAAHSAEASYAHAPEMRRLLHWNHFPVRVYFAAASGKSTRNCNLKEQTADILAGFDLWVTATDQFVRYQVVTKPAEADITVTLIPQTFLLGKRGVVGNTDLTYAGTTMEKADMTLADQDCLSADLKAVAAHEFGHALGIDGHSDDPDDLMYPFLIRLSSFDSGEDDTPPTPPRVVTARDQNTLRLAYSGVLFSASKH